jgi:hypothetical protein
MGLPFSIKKQFNPFCLRKSKKRGFYLWIASLAIVK